MIVLNCLFNYSIIFNLSNQSISIICSVICLNSFMVIPLINGLMGLGLVKELVLIFLFSKLIGYLQI